jgi:hypothetical protein
VECCGGGYPPIEADNFSVRGLELVASGLPAQAVAECMDGNHHLPNAHVDCWATHQVTGARCTSAAQMAYGFEALQEPLPRLGALQATTVAQPVPCWHVSPLNGFGRLTTDAMQARANVEGTRAGGGHGLDVRLVVICDHLVGDHSGALDGVAKERLGTGCVAVPAQEHIHDHAVLIDRTVEIALLVLAKQEDLVDEPAPPDWTPMTSDFVGQARPEGLDPSSTVPWETSMPRSASNSSACRLDSG